MSGVKVRKIFIFIILFLLFCLIGYASYNILKDNNKPKNEQKENKKYELKEMINIKDIHCDKGLCIKDYSITRVEDGSYEFAFTFENKTDVAFKTGCVKMVFSDVDFYVSCYDLVESTGVVSNTFILEEDNFSKYDDYQVVNVTGDELKKYYEDYSKNLVVDREVVEVS